jgi:hypothetical protein
MLGKDQAENFPVKNFQAKKETNMKTNRLHKHLALAAVATAAVVTTSNASVVYSGVINFVCAVDIDGCYVNVETGLLSNGPGSGVPGWDVNPYSTSGGMNFFNSTGGGQMRRPAVTTGTAGNLALNTPVVSTGSYNTGTGNVYGTTSATGLLGGWTYSSENIIGFKFVAAAGTTHYGWMRFAMGAAGSSGTSMTRTIVDYAWETTPGLAINAGVGGGPPPAYDPCATFNPTASVGNNNLSMNLTTAANLVTSCGTAYKANYFKFTAPVDGPYGFNACATNGVKIAVLGGCSAGSSELSCAPCQVSGINLTAGQIVYCVVGGDTEATVLPSPLNIVVSAPQLPACVSAAPAVFGTNVFDDTASTTAQVVQSNAAGTTTATINKSVWYAFTPGATGAYSFSLCGSTGDTMMAIGAVCPTFGTTFQTLAYNDDAPLCSSGGTSNLASIIDATNGGATGTFAGFPLTQDLVSGTTYYIVAGSFSTTLSVTSNLVIDGPPQSLPCPGDYNGDGFRDGSDLATLLSAWGTAGGDINGDGATDGADLSTLLSGWGTCPQ